MQVLVGRRNPVNWKGIPPTSSQISRSFDSTKPLSLRVYSYSELIAISHANPSVNFPPNIPGGLLRRGTSLQSSRSQANARRVDSIVKFPSRDIRAPMINSTSIIGCFALVHPSTLYLNFPLGYAALTAFSSFAVHIRRTHSRDLSRALHGDLLTK